MLETRIRLNLCRDDLFSIADEAFTTFANAFIAQSSQPSHGVVNKMGYHAHCAHIHHHIAGHIIRGPDMVHAQEAFIRRVLA